MPEQQTMRCLFKNFAGLLAYPTAELPGQVAECLALVSPLSGEAASRLASFQQFVAQTTRARLEEVYTGTFDLQVMCYPYVGYQLFGESYKRGAFMVGLKAQYRQYGFAVENELPDHLAVVLSFLAVIDDAGLCRSVVVEGLTPALAKMWRGLEGKDTPYGNLISGLLSLLTAVYPEVADEAGATLAREEA